MAASVAKFLKTTKGVTDESVHSHQSHQEPASNSKTNSPAGLSSQVKRTAWPGGKLAGRGPAAAAAGIRRGEIGWFIE